MVKDLTKTKVHPVAEFFPMMSPEEYEGLKEDIKANGQQEPVCYWRNELIDGRNRLQACQELGIKVEWWELSHDADPIPFIFSKNLHRRHLSTGQRAMLAAKLANLSHGSNQHKSLGKSGKEETPIGVSIETAAKHASVSPQSVTRARQVIADGSKAVRTAVDQGKLKVSTAAELATSGATKPEQTQAIKGGKEAIKVVLKKPAKKEKAPLSKEEQIKAEHKKARSYAEHLQRAIDDLNRIKRNTVVHPELIKLCGQILKGLERW